MKKYIITIAALVALAVPTAAMAASTDANGVVTVSKGEIMAQFPGMNEKAFQKIAMADGRVAHRLQRVHRDDHHRRGLLGRHHPEPLPQHHITSPIALTEIYNGSADKVTGWNLGAKGASVITESNTYGTASSGRFPDYATICAGHGCVTNPFATLAQSHSDVTTFKFNGTPVSIVVTPYVAPAV